MNTLHQTPNTKYQTPDEIDFLRFHQSSEFKGLEFGVLLFRDLPAKPGGASYTRDSAFGEKMRRS